MFGTEVEYGIYVEGVEPAGLDAESARLVAAYEGLAAEQWDYRAETPRQDMRGFEVKHLARDPEDAKLDTQGAGRRPDGTTVTDRILANGARFYNDHAHPEYSTPECASLRDLVAHEKAGERIVLACAQRRARELGRAVVIYKNNTDYAGMSYGAHENYLVSRAVPEERLRAALVPFLVTRTVFTGAGKVGVERHRRPDVVYQISQRADFVEVEASVDTLSRRPIFNTREEPHADPTLFRRLHVICGDANMSEYALALKVGTTALTVAAVEAGLAPDLALAEPVRAMQAVSHDLTLSAPLSLRGGGCATAIAIQRRYLEAARQTLGLDDAEGAWVCEEWGRVLDALEDDFAQLADRLDWVAKCVLLDAFIASDGVSWQDDIVRSLDLAYHDIDPESGLFFGLCGEGRMWRLVSDGEIAQAGANSPAGSRAVLRGVSAARFGGEVAGVRWGRVTFGGSRELPLEHLAAGVPADVERRAIDALAVPDLIRAVTQGAGDGDDVARATACSEPSGANAAPDRA